MRIDCLSVSKHLDPVRPGDDVPVIMPGRCYAVFDGATDVNGNEIDGLSGGRFASTTAAAALIAETATRAAGSYTADELVAAINARLGAALATWSDRLGRKVGAATTMVLMEVMDDRYRFTLVGDSGLRLNGREVVQSLKPVDDITSAGRVLLYRLLKARGVAPDLLEPRSRQGIFHGLDAAVPTLISEEDAAAIIADARAKLAADGMAPELLAEVGQMLRAGIAKGQYRYANVTDHPLGYASINGTVSRGRGFVTFERPAADIRSVELFTDGYLAIPPEATLKAWEDLFARIEAEDPAKTEIWWGVKGSNARQLFDDRTVMILGGLTGER